MKSPFGLYLHIPFCPSRCDYCDFLSFVTRRDDPRLETYIQSLIRTLKEQAGTHAPFTTIYIGGGTPSLVSPALWRPLLTEVSLYLAPGAEWTIEANPESLTEEHLDLFEALGVNRLSIGIQSFQDPLLSAVGRVTRHHDLERTRKILNRWSGRLNVDLICGLPGQTEPGQKDDLKRALDWPCDHISWYSLTVEEGTPLQTKIEAKKLTLTDPDETELWWMEGREFLENQGFYHYEISNFARPGGESRHNMGYWRLDPYLGLGCGAVSTLPGSPHPIRLTGPETAQEFSKLTFKTKEMITPSDMEKDTLMMGLRTAEGISRQRWNSRFSSPWEKRIPKSLEVWKDFFRDTQDHLALGPRGLLVLDAFLREAFDELEKMGEPGFLTWPD